MNRTRNQQLTGNAQALRRGMTQQKRKLWYEFLKQLPCTVNRQKVFGHYIADFYIASARLVIELDGSQHYEEEAMQRDLVRDSYFRSQNMTVLRYINPDVDHHFSNVCEDILRHIAKATKQ